MEQHETNHETTREPAPEGLEGRVIAALRTVYDPELPVNIYDLGLIYGLDVDEAEGKVQIRMTLTAPAVRWRRPSPRPWRMRWRQCRA